METSLKVKLNDENSAKVRAVMAATGLSGRSIVDLFLRSVSAMDLQSIVTFTVEERHPDHLDVPGVRKRIRRRFAIMRNL